MFFQHNLAFWGIMAIGVYADMGTYQTPTGGTREQLGGGNFYF